MRVVSGAVSEPWVVCTRNCGAVLVKVRSLTLSVAVAPDTVRLASSDNPVAKPVKVPV